MVSSVSRNKREQWGTEATSCYRISVSPGVLKVLARALPLSPRPSPPEVCLSVSRSRMVFSSFPMTQLTGHLNPPPLIHSSLHILWDLRTLLPSDFFRSNK